MTLDRQSNGAHMNVTAVYSQAHNAMTCVARTYGLMPFDVRILVALLERGGEARTNDLEWDLRCEGTMIRRSYPALCSVGYVLADAGPGTDQTKRGTRTRLVLTATGRRLANEAIEWTTVPACEGAAA
jgi:hypothetical protein